MIIILLILSGNFLCSSQILPTVNNIETNFDTSNLTLGDYQPATYEDNGEKIVPKMFFYDKFGYLIVNGHVPGQSIPIVLDYKKYANTCTSNIHFFFSFVTPGIGEMAETEKIFAEAGQNLTELDAAEMFSTCPYGITICYEGQLDGDGMRDEFMINNYISEDPYDVQLPSQKIAMQCMLTNDMPNAHGFNMAVIAFPGLELVNISTSKDADMGRFQVHWRFFVFTLSFSREEYYYPVPDDGRITLQIGDRESLATFFTDSNGIVINPVKFTYHDQDYGTLVQRDEDMADPRNRDHFNGHRGIWLLYLDFKRRYNELQVVSSIHSEDCEMYIEIRGNRMRKCRTYLEDIAVTEPSDAPLDFIYTSEIGEIRKSDEGQEDIQEMLDKSEREEMRKKTEKSSEQNKTDDSTKTEKQTITEKKHEEQKTKSESLRFRAKLYGSAQTSKEPKDKPPPDEKKDTNPPGGPPRNRQKPPKQKDPNDPKVPPKPGGTGTTPPPKKPGGSEGKPSGSESGSGNERPGSKPRGAWGRAKDAASKTFGNAKGAARNMVSNAWQSAQNYGKQFLNDAAGNLLQDSMRSIMNGEGVNGVKKAFMKQVDNGIQTLNNATKKATEVANSYIGDSKKLGENLLKQGREKIDAFTSNSKELINRAANTAGEKFNEMSKQARKKVEETGRAYENQLTSKAGQMANGIGSLIARGYDGGNGMLDETQRKISTIFSGKDGKDGMSAVKRMAGGMQNILGSEFGGGLANAGEKLKSHLPSKMTVDSAMSKIKEKIGTNGIMEGGKRLTQNMLNKMPDGIRLPSSYDGIKKMLPNADKVPQMANQIGDRFQSIRGNLAERANPKLLTYKLKNNPYTAKVTDAYQKYKNFKLPSMDFGGRVKIGLGRRKRGAGANMEVEYQHEQGTNSEDNKSTGKLKDSYKVDGTRVFGDVSKSKSLMESFKSTSGIANQMSTAEFLQTSQAFTKKETVDIKVAGLPPGKKVVISQMMFECDGNVIKLPKIIFHDGEEVIDGMSESVMGDRVQSIEDRDPDAQARRNETVVPAVNSTAVTDKPKENKEAKERSMIGKLLADGHDENFDNRTLAERASLDPSVLFEDHEED